MRETVGSLIGTKDNPWGEVQPIDSIEWVSIIRVGEVALGSSTSPYSFGW